MGSVSLNATLRICDRDSRYTTLFAAEGGWNEGMSAPQSLSDQAALKALTQPFEVDVLRQLGWESQLQRLYDLRRIGMLLKLLEWEGTSPRHPSNADPSPDNRIRNTRYMSIQPNEYRGRPVLPDP